MTGGRERGIMVWDARESLLHMRRDAIADELARIVEIEEPLTRKRRERVVELEAEAQRIQLALGHLGPAPRAKMG